MTTEDRAAGVDTDPTPADVDERRARRTWRIAGGGAVLAVALALLTGVAGGEGRAGLVVFLLVTATGCGAAAAYGGGTALIDDLKGRHVSRRRPIAAATLFLLAAMLMAMIAGAGG